MSIYEYDEIRTMRQMREEAFEDGMEHGIEKGIEQEKMEGIRTLIESFLEEGVSEDRILEKLEMKYRLPHEKALEYYHSVAEGKA